jgi:GT2 family glycosyltransferase
VQSYGRITKFVHNSIYGWAFDYRHPDLRLCVEVYVDDACVAVARADESQVLFSPLDLLRGDGYHGFSIVLQSTWLYHAHQLSVRIANRGPWLKGTISLTRAHSAAVMHATPGLASQIIYVGGLRVYGWAWFPEQPNHTLQIQIREGTEQIGSIRADQWQPLFAHPSALYHGFTFEIPWALADGRYHQLHIETQRGQALFGSPIVVYEHHQGLHQLLHHYWPGGDDTPAFRLLSQLAEQRDRQEHRELGLTFYAQWLAVHQRCPARPVPESMLAVGVVVYGCSEQTLAQEQWSRASLDAQYWPVAQTIFCPTAQLLGAMQQLLQRGCTAITVLRCGDRLAPHAVQQFLSSVQTAQQHDLQIAWLYSDCDRVGLDQQPLNTPWFKPCWDPDLFIGVDYISTGIMLLAPIVQSALALFYQKPYALGADDPIHILMAAVVAVSQQQQVRVRHVPYVLYHRHALAPRHPVQSVPDPARQRALTWLLEQTCPEAKLVPCPQYPAIQHVVWPLPARLPTVSVIIPTRDQVQLLRRCVEGVLQQTDYPKLELMIIDNDSRCPETNQYLRYLSEHGVIIIDYPGPFNYAAMNNVAVAQAQGEIVAFLNNDICIREADWLQALLRELMRPNIGAVGAKLLWPNEMVQHGGVIVGIHGLAAHMGTHWHKDDLGYLGYNQVTHRCSAVTAACLVMRRGLFQQIGGFDSRRFPVAFNDTDLCLRVVQAGWQIIWTPHACLEHTESASRGKDIHPEQQARAQRERYAFIDRWGADYPVDPYYHPALSHHSSDGLFTALAMTPYEFVERDQIA